MTLSISEARKSPTGQADWRRISEIKERVLEEDPRLLEPADYPEIRSEVLLSWKRSMLFGVDPNDSGIPCDTDFSPNSRLAQVAQPIMNRLEDQISDLSAWGFLTDRACRLLTSVVGDAPHARQTADVALRPGLCFTEELIGTNGIGTAQESQRAVLISGTEHFRQDAQNITTTGVIIRDPFTKRFVGTLGLHSRREYNLPAVLPWVVEIGRSIETQLAASRSDGERNLFDHFLRAQRRFRGAVVAVSKTLYLANVLARGVVADADEDLLRRIAEEFSVRMRPGTVRRRVSTGHEVTISVTPVEQAYGNFAAVLTIDRVEGARSGGTGVDGSAAPNGGDDFREHIRRALHADQPLLITGESGVGKRHLAVEALRADDAVRQVAELDPSGAQLDPIQWLRNCRTLLENPGVGVVLRRVEDLPAELMPSVSNLLADAKARLIGTSTEDVAAQAPAIILREAFPLSVAVPPLRERTEEFAEICRSILKDLRRDGLGGTLSPKALSALLADDWQGNIRQLRQVLATASVRAAGEIRLADLPPRFQNHDTSLCLGHMERLERQALNAALREANGNRNVAAQKLGVSRATVYRKIKRYGLH